jgi:hypothetical protein
MAVWDPWKSLTKTLGEIFRASRHARGANSRLARKRNRQADFAFLTGEKGDTLIRVPAQEELVENLLHVGRQAAMGRLVTSLVMAKKVVQVVGNNSPEGAQKGVFGSILAAGGCGGQKASEPPRTGPALALALSPPA